MTWPDYSRAEPQHSDPSWHGWQSHSRAQYPEPPHPAPPHVPHAPHSAPQEGPHWMAPVYQMLGRLETGMALGREMADQRAADLREHMDSRIQHLSETIHGRMDRVEKDVAEVKAASTKSNGARPWWRDVSPKEVLTWIATGSVLAAIFRDPSIVDKLAAYALK